jgi:hypothetical protein
VNATESERIDLGDNHSAVIRYMDGEPWGIAYEHQKPDGTPCITASWLPFDIRYGEPRDAEGWTLHSLDPLHIEPSVLCRACGDHGFIRDGRWVRA